MAARHIENATGESRRTRRTLDPIVGSLEDGE